MPNGMPVTSCSHFFSALLLLLQLICRRSLRSSGRSTEHYKKVKFLRLARFFRILNSHCTIGVFLQLSLSFSLARLVRVSAALCVVCERETSNSANKHVISFRCCVAALHFFISPVPFIRLSFFGSAFEYSALAWDARAQCSAARCAFSRQSNDTYLHYMRKRVSATGRDCVSLSRIPRPPLPRRSRRLT